MATASIVAALLFGVFLSSVVLESHLTEAKRSRLYRMKRIPAQHVDDNDAIVDYGNCPEPPSALHTAAKCATVDFGLIQCNISCKAGYRFPMQTSHHKFVVECDETSGFWEAGGAAAGVPDCNPVCPLGCQNGGTCSAPAICTCKDGWSGPDCSIAVKIKCERILTPGNAGLGGVGTELGATATAVCKPSHFFPGGQSRLTYECVRGGAGGNGIWEPQDGQGEGLPTGKFPAACIKGDCAPDYCKNGGTCVGPDECLCPDGTRGPQCEFFKDDCDCPSAPTNGAVAQTEEGDITICQFQCKDGFVPDGTETKFNCRRAGEWRPNADFPKCVRPITTPAPEEITTTTTPEPTVVDPGSDGFCYSYCQGNYRTFDNKKYEFNGKCHYVLAKDCEDDSFEIIVINDAECDYGTDCRRQIKIKAGSATVFLTNEDGRFKVEDGSNSFDRLPYTIHNMEINEDGDMVEVSNDLGFTLRWDKEQYVSVKITKESLKGNMCGLCGDYDGYSTNDFAASVNGQSANTGIRFGLNNKVESASCDDGAVSSYCKADDREKATNLCAALKKGNFSACAMIPEISMKEFMSACVESVCRFDKGINSACCAFEALVRECVRQGGKGAGSWRTNDLCPANCPPGQIYDDCGPSNVATCSNSKSLAKNTKCVEGCRCPDGLALHKGKCIAPSECPCREGGKDYEKGSTINRDCNTCTCQGGSWECTTKVCDATCEGWGDPHYKTFDGKRYDFMGNCSYYLVQSPEMTIIVENRVCTSSGLTCTKSLTVTVGKTEITLLPGMAIRLGNEVGGHKENEFRNEDVYYHHAGSEWVQLDIPELGVAIQWNGIMAFKVIVPGSFFDKTKGLCGTFNRKQKDDFLTPEGDTETDATRFGNKWRTKNCPPTPTPPPCKQPALGAAREACKILKRNPFKKCHAVVPVDPDIEDCIVDHCNCDETKSKTECICDDLRRYADECLAKGHPIGEWRSKVDACKLQCKPGEIYKPCVDDNCQTTCRSVSLSFSLGETGCKYVCTEGCVCPDGQARDKDEVCIPIKDCGCYANGKDYGKGEEMIKMNEDGIYEKCICEGPHFKKCVPLPPECPKPNEKWTDCLNEKCEPKCNSLAEDRICAEPDDCVPGCECKDNYVRNAAGECVLKSKCECEHGGDLFPPGGKIKRECQSCTCVDGKWACDDCECAGTCTAWGDSHYTTFDGKKFEFAGNCEYVLATGNGLDEADFEIAVKNVACGSSGVTCAKKITFTLMVDKTIQQAVLTREGGVTHTSDEAFDVRKVGLFYYIHAKVLGITLLWDKGTLLYVKLDGVFKSKVKGLCGNFNGNEEDDFEPRNGGRALAQAHKFADEWRTNAKCEDAKVEPPQKCETDEKEDYASKKCGVMRGSLFAACHPHVDPAPYFERCVYDTCACDFGGDCECLCTAISVYAELCSRAGVPIRWRSQELCPIQCPCRPENVTVDCPCYNPCIPLLPPKSCLNRFDDKDDSKCDQQSAQCVEGCFAKECPPDKIIDEGPPPKCVGPDTCDGCGIKDGKLITTGDVIKDPCCVCFCDGRFDKASGACHQANGSKGYDMKCHVDAKIRHSHPFEERYKNDAGLKQLEICQNGILKGFEKAGKGMYRAKCQCCPPPKPKPTCGPERVPKLVEEKNKCPIWKCECGPCPKPNYTECKVITDETKDCCPLVHVCPNDKTPEPCEDEIKVCKDVYDEVCGITCQKCEIQCKSCPKDPMPKCGECEELHTIPKTGTCGGCCPKFKCVTKPCAVPPTAACDSCHKMVQQVDKCNCKLPPICELKPCPSVDLPKCTPCQELVEHKDGCNCSTFECVEKTCKIPDPIECPGPCDKEITTTDSCGCETLTCRQHTCDPAPPINCTECQIEKTRTDICDCLVRECKPKPCTVYPTVACDKCHELFVPEPDKCECSAETKCLKKTCATPVPPKCGDCETVLVEVDAECGCKKLSCEPILCPPYPSPNCSKCEHIEDVMTPCGCWEPVCRKTVCPTFPPVTCDLACEREVTPKENDCGCTGESKCVRNLCPTVAPAICTKCEMKKTTANLCGCKYDECVKKNCTRYPPKKCNKCQHAVIINDDCDCPKPDCEDDIIVPSPKPNCTSCEELMEWAGECGKMMYSCKGRSCVKIPIPTCNSCEHRVTQTDDCDCRYFDKCYRNSCPPIVEPECKKCYHVESNVDVCECQNKTCARDKCKNYPSPNCTSCQELENDLDDCDCMKQKCVKRPCGPTPAPPTCDERCYSVEIPVTPCGCKTDGICKRKPCPPLENITCGKCQKAVKRISGPCDCEEMVCEDLPCTKYPSPNCTKCERAGFTKDDCDCQKPLCQQKPCTTSVAPTCSPCQKPEPGKDDCGCPEFTCKSFCLPTTPPTCGKCQTSKVETDKCGCDAIICVDKPCPTSPTLHCTDCQNVASRKNDCGCTELFCEDRPCPTYPTTTCPDPVCEYVAYPDSKDKCDCLVAPICKKYACPSSPPPNCGKCYETVDVTGLCDCPEKQCKKKPCPDSPAPTCGECEKIDIVKNECNCSEPICVAIIPPIPTPPTCGRCEISKEYSDECGGKHWTCVNKCPPDVIIPTCGPCEKLHEERDECCLRSAVCKPIPCLVHPTPSCGKCERIQMEILDCDCKKPVCERVPCTPAPQPNCTDCQILKPKKDECECTYYDCEKRPCTPVKPVTCDKNCDNLVERNDHCDCRLPPYCQRNPCPTPPTPTCDDCHELKRVSVGSCGCTEQKCKPKDCPKYPPKNCTKCDTAFFEDDKCGCSRQGCKPITPVTVTPPTCPMCEIPIKYKDECGNTKYTCGIVTCHNVTIPVCSKCDELEIKEDACGCVLSAQCKRKPCPTRITPTCDPCSEPKTAFDECSCKYEVCDRIPCVSHPSPNCSACQRLKEVSLGCGCKKQVCEEIPCFDAPPPECDLRCETPVIPVNQCGCKQPGYCPRNTCPTPTPPECNECQNIVEKLTEPCGCKSLVCETVPCSNYPKANCNNCEIPVLGKDKCDCPKPGCEVSPCPTPIPPTCSVCEKLNQRKNGCNCTVYTCNKYCPDPVIPECGECQSAQHFTDKCGCDKYECKKDPCPDRPALNCTKCQTKEDKVGPCKCVSSKCVKTPCKKYKDPEDCDDLCEYVDYGENDECGCRPSPRCKKYTCPDSPPPTCPPCYKLKDKTDRCGCIEKICSKEPCIQQPLPKCKACQKVEYINGSCGCAEPICVDIPCPTNIIPPSCKPCEILETRYSDCGCLIWAKCVRAPCPTVTPPTCSDCHHLIGGIGECDCPIKVCDRIPCVAPPSPNCNDCQYIETIPDRCGCSHQECRDRPCTTPATPTCGPCETVITELTPCGCEFKRCGKATCPTKASVSCDPVCERVVEEKDACGCPFSKCDAVLCNEPVMPECGPCEIPVNMTDECGCLHLLCEERPCDPYVPASCAECQIPSDTTDKCGCKVAGCTTLPPADKCVINGIAHEVGSSWANPFDPKCSQCRCVGDKCLNAKLDCDSVASKDCIVFCEEGEWYYPPTKEECENTCGPCCGRCKKPKCNAVSDDVAANKTVGLLKTTKSTRRRNVITCVNKVEIHGLRRCSGACGLAHYSEWTPNTKDSTCACCKTTQHELLSVRMECEDGTSYDQPVKNPTKCDCLPCEADQGGRKKK